MNLDEFVSYCTLKDIIDLKEELTVPAHLHFDSMHKMIVSRGQYKASIVYSIKDGVYTIISTNLYMFTKLGAETFPQPDLKQIVNSILK